MGYLHIDNLYRNQAILAFKECYALEKIHGTSAHVSYRRHCNPEVKYFAGGASHEAFVALFDSADLKARFEALGHPEVTVYGEAYGGKMQGMKETYGPALKFVAFDVKVGEAWLDVPDAADVAAKLGIEFVHYVRILADPAALDAERDRPSVQAVRNGCGADKVSEGVVLRPLRETYDKRGNRLIAKHKRPEFSERKSKRDTPSATALDPEKQAVLEGAEKVAGEWVTPTRVDHVADHLRAVLGRPILSVADTPRFLEALDEDVQREGAGEVPDLAQAKDTRKAIRTLGVRIFHTRIRQQKIDQAVA